MRSSSLRRALVVAGAATVLAACAVPAASAVEPAVTAPDACTVTSATLTWGFKESFRSYISGSIAHGSWEPFDGATYETPAFRWSSGTGEFSVDGTSGTVALPGGVRFTGHDGLLDTTIANPTVVVSGGSAQLLLDVTSVSMENALAGETTPDVSTQIPFVDIDLAGAQTTAAEGTVTFAVTDAPTAVTQEGFDAFGSYPAGTAFDPITVSVTAECPVATPEPSATDPVTDTVTDTAVPVTETAPTDAGDADPWALAGGIAAIVVLGGALAGVIIRRRAGGAAHGPAGDDATGDGPSS